MTSKSQALSLPQLFSILFLLFIVVFAATALQAWTGPIATAPGSNIAAPVIGATTDQAKSAGLSVNALGVFGAQYIQSKLGVGTASPGVSIETPGTLMIGDGGEACQTTVAGAMRYNSTANTVQYCDGTRWHSIASQ